MQVTVKFHGVIRDVTREGTAELELPDDATVDDLLVRLCDKYGQGFADRVLDDRMGIQSYILIFLNDEEVNPSALKTTRLCTDGQNARATLYVLPGSTGG